MSKAEQEPKGASGLRALVLIAMPIALGLTCATTARADASNGGDVAVAQALFDEGKQAMQQHDYAKACPKLAESFRLDPAGGTAFALALCHEGDGKTATAWADFNQALTIARRDHRTERETAASTHIADLEKRLVRVRVVVPDGAPANLEVHRDGVLVGRAQWSVAVPVDPGKHLFAAAAPNKKSWQQEVSTGADGSTTDVNIPALADDAPPPTAPTAPVTTATAPPPAPPPASSATTPQEPTTPSADPGASRRTWAYIAGGVGVVGLGTGAVTGLVASSKWNTAKNACPGKTCSRASDQSLGKDAGTFADVSTVGFIVGGVGLAAAAVLYFTAPSADSASKTALAHGVRVTPILSPSTMGLSVGGSL